MLVFFKSLGVILGLWFIGLVLATVTPQVGLWVGLIFIVVPVVAIFKPLPALWLGHRGFSTCVALFVGVMTTLTSVGATLQAKEMAELRVNDPTAYLAQIKKNDETKWLSELRELDTSRYEIELTRIKEVDAKREAEERVAEEIQLAEAKAAKEISDAATAEAAETRRIEADELRKAERQNEATAHIEMLDREVASIPAINPKKYSGSMQDIKLGLILIGTWGLLYEEGGKLDLGTEGVKKRERFRQLLVQKQSQMLSAMRDGYGPAMRKQLWEADGHASTVGNGFRTVKFAAPAFVRNANIKQIHTEVREQLLMLRFTRAEYRWYKEASEYSYYTLEGPKDSDIVNWTRAGAYQVVQ